MQFKIWVQSNQINYEIYSTFTEVPPLCMLVDFAPFYDVESKDAFCNQLKEFYPNIMSEFYNHLYSIFSSNTECKSVLFPEPIFQRDITNTIQYLVDMDHLEDDNFSNVFKPGLGFGWLNSGKYRKEHFTIFGEHTTRDYVSAAYSKEFENSVFHPELFYNKKSFDFKIPYTKGVISIGLIPPKTSTVCNTVYPRDCTPRAFDIEAKQFFNQFDETKGFIDNYDHPRVCLQNEYLSVAKYCPCIRLSSSINTINVDILEEGFKYCLQDWGLNKCSVQGLTLEEIAKHRTWKSSPGYPYNRQKCRTAQEAYDKYFGLIRHTFIFSQFDWMPTIYNIFCKDEILKKPKVLANDVRTIIAPSVCHQLIAQHCTLSIAEHVGKNFSKSHTQIGRTRFRGDVARTAERVTKFEVIIEYDISKWDRSIKAVLLKLFWFYCWYVYDSDLHTEFWQLANIFESTIYGHLLHRSGEVLRKAYGVPSGFTLTSYANSWIHTYLIFIMYCDLNPIKLKSTQYIQHFTTNVDFVCYGDDGLLGCTAEVNQWFNVGSMSKWFKDKFDMQLDPANCRVVNKLYFELKNNEADGISFLGDVIREFEDGQIQPVFKINKVINSLILNVGKKTYSPAEQILIAFGHYVETFFHPHRDIIYKWLVFVLDKYKMTHISTKYIESEILDYLGINANTLILNLRDLISNDQLNLYIYEQFYRYDFNSKS